MELEITLLLQVVVALDLVDMIIQVDIQMDIITQYKILDQVEEVLLLLTEITTVQVE